MGLCLFAFLCVLFAGFGLLLYLFSAKRRQRACHGRGWTELGGRASFSQTP